MSTPETSPAPSCEPGSFRDPESRVFYAGEEVYRSLSAEGLERLQGARGDQVLEAVPGRRPDRRAPSCVEGTGAPSGDDGQGERGRAQARADPVRLLPLRVAVLDAQGRRAAAARPQPGRARGGHDPQGLERPTTCSSRARSRCSSTSGSFERLREGEPWVGYRQFCMLYLYPLLLQSVKDVSSTRAAAGHDRRHHPRADARPGVASATASARASTSTSSSTPSSRPRHGDRGKEVKAEVKKAGFKKELIVANVRRMRKLVAGLELGPAAGRVGGLRRAQQLHRRRRQAQGRVRARGGHLAALGPDLGHRRATTAATRASPPRARDHVLAVDYDQGPIELLYRTLHEEGDEKMLTLTMNLADPSPGLGWRGLERKALPDRGKPDLRAGARADPPRDDRRQRAGRGVRGLARRAGHRRW